MHDLANLIEMIERILYGVGIVFILSLAATLLYLIKKWREQ